MKSQHEIQGKDLVLSAQLRILICPISFLKYARQLWAI